MAKGAGRPVQGLTEGKRSLGIALPAAAGSTVCHRRAAATNNLLSNIDTSIVVTEPPPSHPSNIPTRGSPKTHALKNERPRTVANHGPWRLCCEIAQTKCDHAAARGINQLRRPAGGNQHRTSPPAPTQSRSRCALRGGLRRNGATVPRQPPARSQWHRHLPPPRRRSTAAATSSPKKITCR